jgi:hypothetical protein
MESPDTPQKRKAIVSYASSPAKRARAISFTVKVSHEAPLIETVVCDSEVPVIPKNPQACLGGVPEELLLNVVEYLEGDETILAKLCCTDRRCKRIAEALLYKNVQGGQYWNKNGRVERISHNTALAENTKKARFVFGAEMTPWTTEYQSLGRTDLVRALSKVSSIQDLYIEEIMEDAVDRSQVAHELGWLHLLDKAVSGSAGTLQNSFAHLKYLRIHTTCLSVAEVSCVFRLPALDALHLHGVHQTTPFETWSIPEASCSVKTLSMKKSFMDVEAVVQIVTSIKALRNFSYNCDVSMWGRLLSEGNSIAHRPVRSWTPLGDALRKHKLSLEVLSLTEYTNESVKPVAHQDGRASGTLGSFKDFPKLTRVSVTMEAFLNLHAGEHDLSAHLPPQLKDFVTGLPLRDGAIMAYYPSALASLRTGLCAKSEMTLELMIDEYLPFPQLRLSEALEPLKAAGVDVIIFDNTYHNLLTLDHLRAREWDDSEDEFEEDSDQDNEESESEEEEEEN